MIKREKKKKRREEEVADVGQFIHYMYEYDRK